MTTYNIETPYFPLILESDDELVRNVFVTHRAEIERQLRLVIKKSPNPKAVNHAKKMLTELDNAR